MTTEGNLSSHYCRALLELLKRDIKPRDIMTRKAFENAITTVMALGGSTNAVLHLLAMAHAVDVPLTLDDFQTISDSTPFIADLKPSGKYVMEDVHKVTLLCLLSLFPILACLPLPLPLPQWQVCHGGCSQDSPASGSAPANVPALGPAIAPALSPAPAFVCVIHFLAALL